jgi:UDP-2-acetamido-3-amino-2,3-dideoxy-glucuronate N-acetyltransferase|tara:strand:- start:3625 stop:4110 length:486 start_codon:yes stop_codon:yes gene_type:complete
MSKDKKFIHKSSFVHKKTKIGKNVKIWRFSSIHENCTIGDNTTIGQNVSIGPNVIIGKNCKIQNNISIYDGVEIEDDVFCGPSAVFTNVRFPRSYIDQKNKFQKTILKKGCTIGANATLVCGITIGEKGFVGAGSVVTKNVKKNSVVVGNPAKILKKIIKF